MLSSDPANDQKPVYSGRIPPVTEWPSMSAPLLKAVSAGGAYALDIHDQQGHALRIDIPEDQGGGGTGFRPMQTLLASLIGCSSVDVVSILRKQRQDLRTLEIEVDGRRDEHGKDVSLWKQIDLVFRLEGAVDPAKAWRAVHLSITRYCSVAETLRRAGAAIRFTVEVNGALVQEPSNGTE
jgi:putative redox protein